MIERIARRAAGFASTTAIRWLGAARNSMPETNIPVVTANGKKEAGGLKNPLGKTAAAGALVLIASNEHVRGVAAAGLRKLSSTVRPDDTGAGRSQETERAPRAATTNGAAGHNGHNGSPTALSDKTRAQLYELAKQRQIPGRSNMSKQELARALTR